MPTQLIQASVAAGELDPRLYNRIDLSKWHIGVKTMVNWYVHAQGGASNRPGTSWLGSVIDSTKLGRLIPFQFSTIQTYVLEFGDFKMRVIKDGGYVTETPVAITATGITNANPGSVHAVAHGYSTGDLVYIQSAAGMTQVNNRFFTITVTGANDFTIGVNTTSYGAWTSGGTVARVYTKVTPYAYADLTLLKYDQSADTVTLTHPSYAIYDLTRSSHTNWTFTARTFAPGGGPSGFVSSSGPGGVGYAITSINDETGEESLTLVGTAANRTSTLTWTDSAGSTLYFVYNLQNGIFGFIGRSGSGASGFTDDNIDPDFSITPPSARNPFTASNYPACSSYHDGRQWFGGPNDHPQTLYGSASSAFNNMSVSQPAKDSDAITRTLASRQVNAIRHIVSLTQMILLTSGAEWKISAGQADVITPAQFVARPQSYYGSSHIRPLVVGDMLLYVPESKKKIRGLQYNWTSDSWSGPDFSLLAAHLFDDNTITNWQFARDPESIIWGIRSDGTLLGFTFLNDQQVYAWHRHTTTNGTFEDVCVIQEGDESAVYFIVKRTINGSTVRYVERLHTRVFATIADAWFLDCGLQYSGSATTTISGLWHLIGETVYALADGITVGPFTVSAAATITLSTAASKVTVGKLMPAVDIETIAAEQQDQSGTQQGRKKKVNHVTLGLKNSANKGLHVGTSGGQTTTQYQIKPKDMVNPLAATPSTAPALITDVMHQVTPPSWDWYGRIKISAMQPLPYTVTGIMYDMTAGS